MKLARDSYLVDKEPESCLGKVHWRLALDLVEDLRELEADLANAASDVLGQGEQVHLEPSGVVAAKLVEQVVDRRRRYLAQDDRLPVVGRVALQEPAADAGKVRVVARFGL